MPLALAQSAGEGAAQSASTHPEVFQISAQTVKRVAKLEVHKIMTTPLSGCLSVPQLCAELDAVLRTELKKSIPGAQFIQREKMR